MNARPAYFSYGLRATMVALACTVSACAQVGDGLRYAVHNVNDFRTDAVTAWHDFKNFRTPPEMAPQPQLRYCYEMRSDIVCYDAPQTNTTSPLVGVQEGVPGRQIAGVEPINEGIVYAEPAPQHDVLATEIEALEMGEIGADDVFEPQAPFQQNTELATPSIEAKKGN